MFAQLVEGGTTPDRRPQMDRLVREDLLHALREEPGFSGAVNLVDRASGQGMMVVFWETEQQASRPFSDYGQRFLDALAEITRISTGMRGPISVWEVNARI